MQKTKQITAILVAASMVLGGCSTAAKDVSVQSISPLQYQSFDCDQITAETMRVQARVNQLGGRLDTAAANDKAITGIGMILFWPALFALGGTKEQEAEYGRLRGESEALHQVAIQKKCITPTPAAQQAVVQPENALRTNGTLTSVNDGQK